MIWGTFATSKHKIINALYISRRLNLVIQKQNERISTLTDIFLEKNILLALGFKPSTRHRMSSCLAIPFSCRDLHLYIVESTIDYFALISCPRVIILKTRHKVCQIASTKYYWGRKMPFRGDFSSMRIRTLGSCLDLDSAHFLSTTCHVCPS